MIHSRQSFPHPVRVLESHHTLVRSNPKTVEFANEQEHRYFKSFWENVAPRFRGAFTVSSVWTSIVLQASYYDSSIRQVIAATGALVRKLDAVEGPPACICDSNDDYSQALQYYQQALKGMRSIKDVRTALIACLLICNFETHTRRIDLAVKTAQSGFKLLNGLLASVQPSKVVAALRPLPEVEKDLVRVFASLDVMLLPVTGGTRLNSRLVQYEPFGPLMGATASAIIPQKFTNIEDAKMCLERLLARHHTEFDKHPGWTSLVPKLQVSKSSAVMTVDFRYRRWISAVQEPENLSADMHTFVKDNLLWARAFEHLPKQIRDLDLEEFTRATLLQLHAQTVCLLFICLPAMQECIFDQYLEEFKGFISLCEIYLALPGSRKPFVSLSCGVLFPLFLTAVRCRDWETRRKAISLLEVNQIEIWDSKLLRQAAIWVMELEESGRAFGEHIPEESRLRVGKLSVDFQDKKAWYTAYRHGVEPEDEANHLVKNLSWQ
ncbi:hypothetical protein D0Z07_4016 [Hyphodiscus hymeniophilus]|uniref:Uncharacterized protein n=1 Tax=Hyphodiscus hymeniophilus TaxID=353542 RepID=A0A9P6VLM9_9HELO|nr:hypothetical protein D0Z07_4016 [Hyphodiscus hymeniophilus]